MRKIVNLIKEYIALIVLNFREHRDNIPQILRLSIADLKKKYHGAALGWAWAVIKPVVTIFVYWFAIEIGLKKGGGVDGYPFILWLVAGIVPWFYINESLTGGTECIRRYGYLVTKMKYPVMTIPTFTNLSRFYINVLLTIVVIILFWAFGYPPTIYVLQLPIYMFLMFITLNAWSLFAGMISAMGKDFSNLIKSTTVAVFWLSGILWNIDNVADNKALTTFLMLNPVTFICYGYRNSLIYHVWFFEQGRRFWYYIIWYVVLAFLSIWAYKKLRKEIPDVL